MDGATGGPQDMSIELVWPDEQNARPRLRPGEEELGERENASPELDWLEQGVGPPQGQQEEAAPAASAPAGVEAEQFADDLLIDLVWPEEQSGRPRLRRGEVDLGGPPDSPPDADSPPNARSPESPSPSEAGAPALPDLLPRRSPRSPRPKVEQAEAPLSRKAASAVAPLGGSADVDVESVPQRSQADIVEQLRQAFGDAVNELRAQTVEEVRLALSGMEDRLTDRMERLLSSAQQAAGEQNRELLWTLERSRSALDNLAERAQLTESDVKGMGDALLARLGIAFQSLVAGIDRSAGAVRDEARAANDHALAEVRQLEEKLAESLNQVAARLERLATEKKHRDDWIEGLADAFDDLAERLGEVDRAGRSRHDRLMALLDEGGAPRAGETGVAEQLAALSAQIEALRRRIAVRARAPGLTEDTVARIADEVASRLEAARDKRDPPALG